LSDVTNISIEKINYKYRAFYETFDIPIKTGEDLIAYANEQKKAIES